MNEVGQKPVICQRCKKNLSEIARVLGDWPAALFMHDKAHLLADCVAAERRVDALEAENASLRKRLRELLK